MRMLHSFYCWGQVGVVLVSTVFFTLFGIGSWRILSVSFAAIAVANMILFGNSPIGTLNGAGEKGMSLKAPFSVRMLFVFRIMVL